MGVVRSNAAHNRSNSTINLEGEHGYHPGGSFKKKHDHLSIEFDKSQMHNSTSASKIHSETVSICILFRVLIYLIFVCSFLML